MFRIVLPKRHQGAGSIIESVGMSRTSAKAITIRISEALAEKLDWKKEDNVIISEGVQEDTGKVRLEKVRNSDFNTYKITSSKGGTSVYTTLRGLSFAKGPQMPMIEADFSYNEVENIIIVDVPSSLLKTQGRE